MTLQSAINLSYHTKVDLVPHMLEIHKISIIRAHGVIFGSIFNILLYTITSFYTIIKLQHPENTPGSFNYKKSEFSHKWYFFDPHDFFMLHT